MSEWGRKWKAGTRKRRSAETEKKHSVVSRSGRDPVFFHHDLSKHTTGLKNVEWGWWGVGGGGGIRRGGGGGSGCAFSFINRMYNTRLGEVLAKTHFAERNETKRLI